MKILTRYVLFDLLKWFAMVAAGLTLFMVVVGVAKEALDEGLGVKQVLLLIPYILPEALLFTLPASVLAAAAAVYGRMSGQNEIVALKSLGISPMPVLLPGYVMAVAVSIAMVPLNDVAVSWGRNGVTRVVLQAIDEIAYSRLASRKTFSNDRFSINVKRVEGRRLIEPVFAFRDKNGHNVTVRCEFAELSVNDMSLAVQCFRGVVDLDGKSSYEFPDFLVREFALSDVKKGSGISPANMPLAQIFSEMTEQERKLEAERQSMAAKAALQMARGDLAAVTGITWPAEYADHDGLLYYWHRLRAEPPRRWSNGFTCLTFMLSGSVMAIWLRSANFIKSFFVCFLPILIVYYPLLVMGVDMAKSGTAHPYIVWVANGVLSVGSLVPLRWVIRY